MKREVSVVLSQGESGGAWVEGGGRAVTEEDRGTNRSCCLPLGGRIHGFLCELQVRLF